MRRLPRLCAALWFISAPNRSETSLRRTSGRDIQNGTLTWTDWTDSHIHGCDTVRRQLPTYAEANNRHQQPGAEAQPNTGTVRVGRGLDGEGRKISRLDPRPRDGPGSSLSMTALEATPPLHHRPSFKAPPAPAPFLASQDPCQDPASQCHTHVPKLDFTSLRWKRKHLQICGFIRALRCQRGKSTQLGSIWFILIRRR